MQIFTDRSLRPGRRRVLWLVAAVVVLGGDIAATSPALAMGEPLGSAWLSFSPTELVTEVTISPSDMVRFYVWIDIDFAEIAQPWRNLTDGLQGINITSWVSYLQTPCYGQTWLYPGPSDCHPTCDAGEQWGWCVQCEPVGVGGKPFLEIEAPGPPLGTSEITIFGGDVGEIQYPFWIDCSAAPQFDRSHHFTGGWHTSRLTLNVVPVATSEQSWGTLKARFGSE